MPVVRLACFPDMPQGLPKKIQFNLLLADLAFQLTDALARCRKILARLKIEHAKPFARPTRRPQRLGTTLAEMPTPFVQMSARNPKLARERCNALPRYHSLDRRDLELPAKCPTLAFGHSSLLENCALFFCLSLGVHSRSSGRICPCSLWSLICGPNNM